MNYLRVLCFCLFSQVVYAQESIQVIISLKAGENIPTVDDVYQEGQLSSPPANDLISAFDTASPQEIDYLMKLRAYGDLKTLNMLWG
ncbi:hypothetical protein MNBD_GAMMA02-894 [hydrothermal vent metagenome]|uniref:Uncharacterized protein n=1 Tax=hydrothermal vent metagenome TaxID=652676 RepID=A0A3B0VMR6_9ZZZZ